MELENAKELWEKYVQRKYLGDVILATVDGKEHLLKNQLGLWMDERHILRCSGRLINAQLTDEAKFPKLLPRKAHFTRLVIKDCHEKLYHVGVSHVLSQIRNEYWIPRGRAEVYRVIKSCFRCNKYDGGPFRMPDMPPWPHSRVTIAPPFTHTGLDYLGPLYVKEGNHTRKVWICLFTCLVVRAVHLEVVGDMTAEEFLMCLRRFVARRGIPCQILSDNAPQFKLTKTVIDRAWENSILNEETKIYCTQRGIAWKFIVEMAPWMGGFYERLVRLVKQSLRKSLGKICLTRVQLETVVCEIESVINTRPLIYVGSDFESGEVLTPAKFLTPGARTGVPVTKATAFKESDYENLGSKDKLLYMWDKGQRLLDSFWRIWRDGYLLSLRERFQSRIKEPRSTANHAPKIGDIIQIKDNLPRGSWRIARIKEFMTSQDGNIRAAKIMLPHGRILSRSIGHLYPLECEQSLSEAKLSETSSSTNTKLESLPPVGNEGNPSSDRPVRKSAIEAKKKMQKWLNENFVGLWSVAMIARRELEWNT